MCVCLSLSRALAHPLGLFSCSLCHSLSRSLVRTLSRSLHLEVRMPVLTLLIKLQVFNMQLLVFTSPFLQVRVVRDRRCRCSVFFCILFLVQIVVTAGPCRPSSPPPLFCVLMCYHSLARCLLPSRAHTYTALTRTHLHHTPLTLTNKTHTTHAHHTHKISLTNHTPHTHTTHKNSLTHHTLKNTPQKMQHTHLQRGLFAFLLYPSAALRPALQINKKRE